MSAEDRPNLQAVGLLTDILKAIQQRVRGNAAKAGLVLVIPLVSDPAREFVERIDALLDYTFGIEDLVPPERKDLAVDIAMAEAPAGGPFEQFMNQMVAPLSDAWSGYRVTHITVLPGDLQHDSAIFHLTLNARRKKC